MTIKHIKRSCLNCGKDIRNSKFCSNKCHGEYQQVHPYKTTNGEKKFCSHCGAEFFPSNYRHRFCSSACRDMEYAKGHKTIWIRDGFRCVYCGHSSIEDGVKLTLDHIVARDRGGEDIAGNLVTACWDCNSSKNASLLPDKIYKRITRLIKSRNKAAGISNTQKITSPGWKIGFKHRKNDT